MNITTLITEEAKRRGLSQRTIDTYCFCVNYFIKWNKKEINQITKLDIKDFMDYLLSKQRTGSTLNVYINALKFFIEEVLNKKLTYNIKYSKTPNKLPEFLTKQEVKKLIEEIKNLKYRLMVEIMYSAGLRISELLNLKVRDIDFNSKIGWVREGKGKKDRIFIIADKIINRLANYIQIENLEEHIFIGRNGKLSVRSLQEVVKKAAKKSGIKKNVHCHTLRHSFATHLVENGYDLASIQSLLGHSSSKTTMVYIHMASPKLINVKSPYDNL